MCTILEERIGQLDQFGGINLVPIRNFTCTMCKYLNTSIKQIKNIQCIHMYLLLEQNTFLLHEGKVFTKSPKISTTC